MISNNIVAMAKPYEQQWEKPEMAVLVGYQNNPPEFPLQLLGAMEEWVKNAAELKSAPVDYVASALLCMVAGLIGNAMSVSAWSGWVEPIILWVANVGLPSSNKSPALDAILDSVYALQSEMQRGFKDEVRDYESKLEASLIENEAWKTDLKDAIKNKQPQPPKPSKAVEPDFPACPRILVTDATIEALSTVLIENPRGVLSVQDELSGWIENQDRYAGAGSDRAFWLQAFGGRPYIVDRVKNQGKQGKRGNIPRLSISICGGIQPGVLHDCLLNGADSDSGLSARFLYVWPEAVPPRRPHGIEDNLTIFHVVQRLHSIQSERNEHGELKPAVLFLDEMAAERFQEFRVKLGQFGGFSQGLMLSHLGKMPGITLRLALVLEMLWWATSSNKTLPASVSLSALSAASSLVENYFLPMAVRTFGSASLPPEARQAMALAKWIFGEKPTMVNASALRRYRVAGLKTASEVGSAVENLVDANWLILKPSRKGDNAGRQKADYLVNPLIWQDQDVKL